MKNNLWNILRKELRELFRDKKSLAMMLIIPIFIPFLIIGMSALFEAQMNKEIEEYNKIGVTYILTEEEKSIAKEMKIEMTQASEEEIKDKYEKGEINSYITKNDNYYTIYGNSSENSTYAKELARSYLNSYKQLLQQHYLQEKAIPSNDVFEIITIEEKIEEENNFFVNYIKNYGFLFTIMAITVSATYPSTDTTAGEKERGTLETLLTFPIKSKDIILGKFLGVSISSVITGVISFLLSIISLSIVQNAFTIYEGINVMYEPITIVFALLVILTYSFFISGLCIAIASKAKGFKEAQSALTPLTFISFFPGMIAFLADIITTPLLSVIPFLNYTMIFTDIANGKVEYINIALMLISTFVYMGIILKIIIKQYKSEKVLFSK